MTVLRYLTPVGYYNNAPLRKYTEGKLRWSPAVKLIWMQAKLPAQKAAPWGYNRISSVVRIALFTGDYKKQVTVSENSRRALNSLECNRFAERTRKSFFFTKKSLTLLKSNDEIVRQYKWTACVVWRSLTYVLWMLPIPFQVNNASFVTNISAVNQGFSAFCCNNHSYNLTSNG